MYVMLLTEHVCQTIIATNTHVTTARNNYCHGTSDIQTLIYRIFVEVSANIAFNRICYQKGIVTDINE